MHDPRDAAKRKLSLILVAALTLRPLDPHLTEDELKAAAMKCGVSPGLFHDVLSEFWDDHKDGASTDRVSVSSMDLIFLVASHGSYPLAIPIGPVERLEQAFTRLEEQLGTPVSKTLELLMSEYGDPPDEVRLALGFLLTHKHVERVGGGFRRRLNLGGSFGKNDRDHPANAALATAMAAVESVLSARTNEASPSTPPVDRFYLLLRKQGWDAFASWWALTSRELSALSDHYPTSSTVLAGALLEAALTAISDVARDGGHWRQRFLSEKTPEQWTLSKLIDQATEAGTFDQGDRAMAEKLADFRNRIHAGRFHTGGKGPFTPRSVDGQEAHLAKLHLDHLLKRILDWRPVAGLV
jgi:hypothetical protein